MNKSILIGNRIPKHFFQTSGVGESDIAIHAGSYHIALLDAGIEMANIMTYSSILPRISVKIDKPDFIEHGCVLESIMSVCTGKKKNELLSAGIIYGYLKNKNSGEIYGGLVCEREGVGIEEERLKKELYYSLSELYENGIEQVTKEKYTTIFDLVNINHLTKSFIHKKQYGTAIVALCFTSYEIPIL